MNSINVLFGSLNEPAKAIVSNLRNVRSICKLYLFSLLFVTTFAYCEPVPVGPLTFGKGLNLLQIPISIADDDSPDLCNCSPTFQGSMQKRNGSSRFISQAISSYPVTSLYRGYASSGTVSRKVLIATNRDKILVSTDDVNPQWIVVSSNNALGQHYTFTTMNGKVIIAGDGQSENTVQYDIINSSLSQVFGIDGATSGINVRPKYQIASKNYYIAANVAISTSFTPLTTNTTYYPSRIVYSLLNNPSSMTAQRFIDFRAQDGEEITGIGNMNDKTDFFKPSSIGELSFTILNLPSQGGDWIFTEIVSGFGCIAPRTLAVIGDKSYIFLSKDGIRVWDNRARLNSDFETSIVSLKIKPLIDEVIRAGTYKSAVGIYYPKKQWYVLSYENPNKSPHGKNNSVLVYDLLTKEWWPFCNWLADSLVTADNVGDTGQLFYGDATDSYVHKADLDTQTDDSRKEIVLDVMDSTFSWAGSTQDVTNVKEGTASLKIGVGAPPVANTVTESSMTNLNVFQIGEWYDRTKASKSDKIAFKGFVQNISSVVYLRIDLEVNDTTNSLFDTNFTSVTLSSSAFTGGDNAWTSFEIPLSSFPIRPDWADLGTELVPFANTPSFYGIRFVLGGIYFSSVSVDDLRFVQATNNPNRMYRFTKLFNMNTPAYKGFGQVLLTRELFADSNFNVDIYDDFGQVVKTIQVPAEIPKEIFVTGFSSGNNVTVLNSIDYSVLRQTSAPDSVWTALNGVVGRKYLFLSDRANDRFLKFDRSTFTVLVASYGSFGSGTNQTNLVHQQAIDDSNYFVVDMTNQRIKQHLQNDFSFVQMAGSLGNQATSYHQPTGICVNNANIIVADEGNSRLTKLSKSTMGVVAQVTLDYNTIGDSTLQNDEKNLYLAYNKISEVSSNYQDVILEKRDIGDLSLSNRIRVTPFGTVTFSTYIIMGDIALLGRYVYISFTDALQESTANYYIQKRLKSDFSLVSEYKTPNVMYSLMGDGQPYKPTLSTIRFDLKVGGRYIQLKFYDNALDNSWKLYEQTFLATPTSETY